MKFFSLVLPLALFACSGSGVAGPPGTQGERGLQGERGPQGLQGIQGLPGPGPRFVDARGVEQRRIITVSDGLRPALAYVDDTGVLWQVIDWRKPVLAPWASSAFYVGYESSDCTGPAFIPDSLPPRFAFRLSIIGLVDRTLVRDDHTPSRSVVIHSRRFSLENGSTDCDHAFEPQTIEQAVHFDAVVPAHELTAPSASFTPPLHQELRE